MDYGCFLFINDLLLFSLEHIGPDGESSSVVIVEETKKFKGAIGLLTRKIKTKMASSKSDPGKVD